MTEEDMAKKGGYGFGIVGCGMVADFHAQAIAAMKGGHLACVFSRRQESAARVAKAHGCDRPKKPPGPASTFFAKNPSKLRWSESIR
jgi:predicted dehydrogenase